MPKTLLLADDSVTIQKVVGISFANEDVRLVTVDNGDDAVARARELRPDIVLADVVMPGMNGYEVCETLKADPSLRHIPVLLLTGTFEAFDEARAARAGADGHITKPFEAQALVDMVNARLAAGSSAAVAPAMEPAQLEEASLAVPSARGEGLVDDDPLGGDAFDFFGEEAATGSEARGMDPSESATSVLLGDALGAGDAADDAFAFDAPERSHRDTTPTPRSWETPPEATADQERAFPTVVEPGASGPALGEAGGLLGEDSDLDGPDTGPPDFLADLDAELPAVRPAAAGPRVSAGGDAAAGQDALDDLFATEEEEMVELELEPAGAADDPDAARFTELGPEDLAGDTVLDPMRGRDYDVSSSDLSESFAAPEEPLPAPSAPQPIEPRLPMPAAARPEAAPAPAEDVARAPDLGPAMRQQLHEALEKIAWEAFSDSSERIVKEAVARIEAVAWEVIPQMAEALIREEIRRLQGDETPGT
jgi:CheY-like chemotaxis protein